MRVLVTGATGFIGRHLLPHLKRPVVLSRYGTRQQSALSALDVTTYDWLPHTGPPPAQAFDEVEAVIHLAGESVVGRWTRAKKRRIFESRVTGTSNLVGTLSQLSHPPRVLISASAVGYYGSRGDDLLDEAAPPGRGFLADLCIAWESAASAAASLGIRVVLLRTGLVFGHDGGALPRMLPPFRFGLGGRLGDGRQWMPWIHVDDLVRVILLLTENATISGPVNAASPQPVTNAEFTRSLGLALHRPAWCTVPAPFMRLALGEFAQVLLASQRAMPCVLARAGFEYRFPQLDHALREILRS
jgi:uncharacterized protein (TIGR01777 family)